MLSFLKRKQKATLPPTEKQAGAEAQEAEATNPSAIESAPAVKSASPRPKRRSLFGVVPTSSPGKAGGSDHAGWLRRLRAGLSKSSARLSEGIGAILSSKTLDEATLEELEELLIAADMGVETSAHLVDKLRKSRFDKQTTAEDVRHILAEEINAVLEPVSGPVDVDEAKRPFIVLVVGVNGNGKTTTVGKMAHLLLEGGWSVMLCAADTFRAAAVEQLKIWGERCGCGVVTGEEGADPASVAFRAIEEARKSDTDVLLIDTAGRLQNKQNLMAELQKVVRVIHKLDETGPHCVIQILDATTGQNAHSQVEAFSEMVGVTGLVVTKLDGTAKGGVVVALARKYGVPIHAVGVGEGIEDLKPFSAQDFAQGLMGVE